MTLFTWVQRGCRVRPNLRRWGGPLQVNASCPSAATSKAWARNGATVSTPGDAGLGGETGRRIISFIERCQADVIERILRHVGLWEGPVRTLATARAPPATHTASAEPGELNLVLDGEFLEHECQEAEASPPDELQLVLVPEFL